MKYKLPCEIVRDLLPSYIDGITEEITNQAVEEHLCECTDCTSVLERMRNDIVSKDAEENAQMQKEIEYLKKVRRKSRIPLVILMAVLLCVVVGVVWCVAPIIIEFNKENITLTEAQVESLCEQFVLNEFEDDKECAEDYLPISEEAGVEIYGAEREGEIGYIYGYVACERYARFKGKAYDISGGNNPFKVKVKFEGDEVEILKIYGDGMTDKATLEEFPVRYLWKHKLYNSHDSKGYCKVQKIADDKIEEKWNVEVEQEYLLTVDDNGYYEIWDFTEDEGIVYLETGWLEKRN